MLSWTMKFTKFFSKRDLLIMAIVLLLVLSFCYFLTHRKPCQPCHAWATNIFEYLEASGYLGLGAFVLIAVGVFFLVTDFFLPLWDNFVDFWNRKK